MNGSDGGNPNDRLTICEAIRSFLEPSRGSSSGWRTSGASSGTVMSDRGLVTASPILRSIRIRKRKSTV
jgi:hypothetical protein